MTNTGEAALKKLEEWANASKARGVKIHKDNGYGASCWEVSLYAGKEHVTAYEARFWEGQVSPNVVFVSIQTSVMTGLAWGQPF